MVVVVNYDKITCMKFCILIQNYYVRKTFFMNQLFERYNT
jgi:hypothetical protein